MQRWLCLLPQARHSAVALVAVLVAALPAVIHAAPEPVVTGDVPIADYLALLGQISPAAQQGAQTYLQAYERRCRRILTSRELRLAMAEGNGDPVLMAMIRASHVQDRPGLTRLGDQVNCARKAPR